MLPELRSIILDYLASMVLYERKQRLHRELIHRFVLQEMRIFYSVFHTITITVTEDDTDTQQLLLT